MVTVRGKHHDENTGKYYLYCSGDRAAQLGLYEVDGATYHEASVGLMYNPAKVARWKFIGTQ